MNWNLFVSYSALLIVIFLVFMKRTISDLIAGRKEFKCRRCGHCCRLGVKLYSEDIENLKKVTKEEFIDKKDGKNHLRKINEYCTFLSIEKGHAKCRVYGNRPKICRDFPRIRVFGLKANDSRCCSFSAKE